LFYNNTYYNIVIIINLILIEQAKFNKSNNMWVSVIDDMYDEDYLRLIKCDGHNKIKKFFFWKYQIKNLQKKKKKKKKNKKKKKKLILLLLLLLLLLLQ